MGSDRLDRFIKGKVQSHKTISDTDLLWQKIQAKQAAKKKDKRRFFFIWFFIGILLFSSGLDLYLNSNNSMAEPTNSVTQSLETNDPIQSSTSLTNPISESKTTDKNTNKKTNVLITSPQSKISKSEVLVNKNNLSKKEKPFTDSSTLSSFDQSSPNFVKSLSKKEEPKKEIHRELIEYKKVDNFISTNDKRGTNSEFKILAPLSLRAYKVEYSNPFDQFKKEKSTFPKVKNTKQFNFSTELFFNYGLVDRTLKSDDEIYLKIRKSHETPMDIISIGLNFSIQHKSNFYLKAGLEYQQINERFENYSSWDSTIVAPDQIIAITYDMDGNSTNTIGEGLVSETYFSSRKIYNRYRSIELPIQIGYTSSKQKVNWFAEGGLALNLWFKPDGEILNEFENSILLKENKSYFKSRTGLSLISTIGISYQLDKKISLSAAPNFKYQLRSISSELNPIDQKYLTIGLRLGLGYSW